MATWLKRHGLFFLIVALGLSLRLINLQQWFHFEMDEEVVAWKTRQLWQFGKPFLIGGGTPFGFHLGPAFYYLSSIPLWLAHGNPISLGLLAAMFGVLTISLCFYVGSLLYSKRVGIVFALLWSTSFVATMSDRHWWPLVLDPLFSVLALLSLYKILKGGRHWWIILGLALAFAWQADLTILPLFLAAIVMGTLRFRVEAKQILFCALLVLMSFIPLIVFEFRHPGANLGKIVFSHFGERASVSSSALLSPFLKTPRILSRLLIPTKVDENLNTFYSWCKTESLGRESAVSFVSLFLGMGVIAAPLYFVLKTSPTHKKSDLLVLLFFSCGVGGFLIFSTAGGDLFDFYLASLYPIFLLSTARIIEFLWHRYAIVAIVIFSIIVSTNIVAVFSSFHPQSLAVKQAAISWVATRVSVPFALESLSQCHRFNGIRYLFMSSGHEPDLSFMDYSLSWLYDVQPTADYPDTLVVFVTPTDLTLLERERYNELQTHVIDRRAFGDFDVLIVNNETHTFTVAF